MAGIVLEGVSRRYGPVAAVDGVDLAIVLTNWGSDGGKDSPHADIDRSGLVDGGDLAAVLDAWGPCP